MLQVGTKNVFLYLPSDEEGVVEMGGEYDEKLKRWRFPLSNQFEVTEFVKQKYPEFFEEGDEEEDDEEEDHSMSPPIDKRLHRAQSFSQYDDEDEDDDEELSDLERSRSRSRKFKKCARCRAPLSNKQFCTKRNLIKSRML